jgi:gluconate 2-dehydrogenase subunit 3-like protein
MAKERYPGFDVLQQASHWDEVTRALVLDRVERVPEIRYFTQREAATLRALCDHLTGQDHEPRIPVLAYVDEKLHDGPLDGYRYADMPDDPETWRRVARGLDEEAERRGAPTFAVLPVAEQRTVCGMFARGELAGETWGTLNASRAFGVVMRHICEAFYGHPWAWNEIGFPGPAYPRGYASFGSPHLDDESEAWEPKEVGD